MADVEKDIVLRVKSETDQATGQFKSLKQELRSIETQLNQMAQSGDTGSAAFQKLQARAGELKDQIGDTKAAIKALSSDTFKLDAFTQAAQGIAGGFAAAQGAMSLFGTENKAVEEAIKKTQGAMALLQGVTAITNILQKETAFSAFFLGRAQQANSIATEGAAVATKGFSKALIATGIGAIIVAVGTLIAYWDDLSEAIGLTNNDLEITKKAVESVGESFGKERAEVEQLTYEFNQHNTSAKRKQEIIGELQKISPNYFGTLNKEKTTVEQLAVAQNKFNTALQKQALLKGFQKQLEELGNEQAKLNVQIETGTAEAGFFTKHFVAMKNIFTEDIFNAEAIAGKMQAAGAEEATQKIEQNQKQINAVLKLIKKTEDELNKMGGEAVVEEQKNVEKRVKLKKDLGEEDSKNNEKILAERKKLSEGLEEIEIKRLAKEGELARQSEENQKNSFDKLKEFNAEFNASTQAAIANTQKIRENEAKAQDEMVNLIGSGLGEISKLVGENTKAGKAFAIASTLVDTYQAAQKAYLSQVTIPSPDAPIRANIAAAIAIAQGLARVKAISGIKIGKNATNSPSAPASGGGSIPSPSTQATQTSGLDSTQLQLDAQGNLLQQRTMRTYVLETDISAKQQRSKRLQQTATLGK